MIILIILLLVILGGVTYYFNKKINTLNKEFAKERYAIRIDAKKRSGAVQWGKTIEHFVPFMSDFPIPAEDVTFLGMPIDYVGFSNTESKTKCSVHFVEVKKVLNVTVIRIIYIKTQKFFRSNSVKITNSITGGQTKCVLWFRR